jgi:hypothetical protein
MNSINQYSSLVNVELESSILDVKIQSPFKKYTKNMGRSLKTIEKKENNSFTFKIVTYNTLCPNYCSKFQVILLFFKLKFPYVARNNILWE